MIERILVTQHAGASSSQTLVLPEPKAGRPQAYMLAGDDGSVLLEVQRFKPAFSSWLVDGELVPDGGLYLATPIDPLFVLLPLLEKRRHRAKGSDSTEGRYVDFPALFDTSEDGPFVHMNQLQSLALPLLPCICDCKQVDSDTYYRLNDERVLAWLMIKFNSAREALSGSLSGLDEDAQKAYVIGFLGEFLSEHWTAQLMTRLNVDPAALSGQSADVGAPRAAAVDAANLDASKRVKVDPKEHAREQARKKAAETKAANMAKLAQGTKSITSFFKPRT